MQGADGYVEPAWRGTVSRLGAAFLGAILVVATVGKVGDPVLFVEQIRKEGLDFLLPAHVVALVALAVEMGLGIALLLGIRQRLVWGASALLVAFFLFLTGRNYYLVLIGERDPNYDCGCFGVFLQRSATEAFWQDLALLIPPLLLAVLSPRALRTPPAAWQTAAAAAGAAGIVIYTLAFVDLPRREPVLETAGGTPGVLHLADQFLVRVDGSDNEGGQVFESDSDLRLAVQLDGWKELLILDIRTSRVWAVPLERTRRTETGDLEVPPDLPMDEVGDFDVGPEGLTLTYQGNVIQIRNR